MRGQRASRRVRKPGHDEINGQTAPLPRPERKAAYVRELFVRIASRYDLMNRVMTFGRDRAWRRATVAQALVAVRNEVAGRRRARILDVATGTGDLALETVRQEPGVQVVGLDFVPEMLSVAQRKVTHPAHRWPAGQRNATPSWAGGDALHLPFPDGCFEGVVTGFALRNVTDIPAAFAEMARVTRPGGRLACLEIAKPRLPLFRHLFSLYFHRMVPLLGALLTGQRLAYTYLPHSLTQFLTPGEIVEVMRDAGWYDVRFRRLMLGAVALHTGRRVGDHL